MFQNLKYKYEVWKGKKLIGYYHTYQTLMGKFVVINKYSILKQPYNCRFPTVTFPLKTVCIHPGGPEYVIRVVIDATGKKESQIKYLLSERL